MSGLRRSFLGSRRTGGFTIIELVITLAIVALLATAILPSAQLMYQRERESQLRDALRIIRGGIDAYKKASDTGHIKKDVDKSGYPPDLQTLVDGVDDARNPKEGTKIYFLRAIPRDPLWPDATTPAAETWALRSYASPPDAPEPGDDVYDVHTMSPKIGLNGVPYSEW
jgi:general secretion pathway protein G